MSTGDSTDGAAVNSYRSQSWDYAVHTFGTAYVFGHRARQLKRKLHWVNYVGIAVPLLVGSLVLALGPFQLLPFIIAVAGLVGGAQVAFNLWSIIGRWVEEYAYALTSVAENDRLCRRFCELGAHPPETLRELKQQYSELQLEDSKRREQDHQHGITDAERRMGMRAALRQFQRPCAGCRAVPTSMEPGDCGVCGNFKYTDR
jgi:mobilome CxxCx(11)CxxC protein